jgi:predicted transcriptional regulator
VKVPTLSELDARMTPAQRQRLDVHLEEDSGCSRCEQDGRRRNKDPHAVKPQLLEILLKSKKIHMFITCFLSPHFNLALDVDGHDAAVGNRQ